MVAQSRSAHPFLIHYHKIMNTTSNFSSDDLNVIFRICYSAAWFAGVTCVLHLTYKCIREYTYVIVNCWFCNGNIKVPFNQRKEWICSQCEQFNGFNKDGDYIRPIPEQYDERLNFSNGNVVMSRKSKISSLNGLCRTCNANQELKIRQIASYVPLREKDYDYEIELFKKKLEKSYKLCAVCERTVQSTIKLKSNLYAAKIPEKGQNSLKNVVTDKQSNYVQWSYIASLLLFTILLASLWKYQRVLHEYSMFDTVSCIQDFFVAIRDNLSSNHRSLINISTVILATCLSRSIVGKATILLTLLAGILVFFTYGLVASIIKVAFSFLGVVYFIHKRTSCYIKAQQSLRKISTPEECETYFLNASSRKPNSTQIDLNPNNPLCGSFSSLSLGRYQTISRKGSSSSYLFKSNKLLIRPAKLIVDDLNLSIESMLSSPTISSGYDSVSSFLQKSSDSISEFDSVSQISNHYHANVFHASMTNALVPYKTKHKPLRVKSHGPYYGVSSVRSSPDQSFSKLNTSNVEVNALFSTFQIFLCSLAFFVLGLSFQLIVSQVKI